MNNVFLFRLSRNDHGTRGVLFTNGFSCHSLELPWKNNAPNMSCIPADTYEVTIRVSPKYGKIYWVLKVNGRTHILIHSGNFAGDKTKGLRTHTNGCILLCMKKGKLSGQSAVLMSRVAIRKFMDLMNGKKFNLTILEGFTC